MSSTKLIFQLLSDIHLELVGDVRVIKAMAPYLFLAGDITNVNHKSFSKFFKYCNDNWIKTFYIPGNHEYYSKSNTIHEIKNKMNKYFEDNKLNNIVFMDNNTYEIEPNIFIIGSTFWTPAPNDTHHQRQLMLNDYNYILTKCL